MVPPCLPSSLVRTDMTFCATFTGPEPTASVLDWSVRTNGAIVWGASMTRTCLPALRLGKSSRKPGRQCVLVHRLSCAMWATLLASSQPAGIPHNGCGKIWFNHATGTASTFPRKILRIRELDSIHRPGGNLAILVQGRMVQSLNHIASLHRRSVSLICERLDVIELNDHTRSSTCSHIPADDFDHSYIYREVTHLRMISCPLSAIRSRQFGQHGSCNDSRCQHDTAR